MQKLSLLFIVIFSLLFTGNVEAQSTASISKIVKNGERIELTVSASQPFYVGGNIHVLHIGKKDFSLSKQKNFDGKGNIIFYIPVEDFNSLTEGAYIWMSYGNILKQTPDPETDPSAFCKNNSKTCWILGKLNKTFSGN